ncbi:MAG: tetratricopeptide repeat protein [Rhodospirillaceae bacterium]
MVLNFPQNGIPNQADPELINAWLEEGFQLHQAGQLDQAIALYQRVLKADPKNVEALYLSGAVNVMRENYLEAVIQLSSALKTDPDFAPAYGLLGEAQKNLGDYHSAAANYQRAITFEPENFDLWNQYGNALRLSGDIAGAQKAYAKKSALKYRPGEQSVSDNPDFSFTSKTKLRHDIEQFQYLIEKNKIDRRYQQTIDTYTDLLENFPINPDDPYTSPIPESFRAEFAPTYNRHVYFRDTPASSQSIINPSLDPAAIEADYAKNEPGITYFDDFLKPDTLQAIREHCLESMVWHEFRYANGYLGAFMNEGFFCPLLNQIVEALPKTLPGIFKDHQLINLWGYKYDSSMTGIDRHADEAAVNVNFWITPDDANLDPNTGGLVIWNQEAPLDWDFEKFNADQDAIKAFLEESGAQSIRVPHKQNRAVIFNSDLFHATDEIHFKNGYENRRINITLLYGRRHQD